MAKVHRLLVLEDSELDFVLLERTLQKFFRSLDIQLSISRADSKESFESKFIGADWDCVVTDFNIPGYSALAAIDLVRRERPTSCPVLVYSGAIGEEMTVEVIKRGAADLILKSDLSRIGPSILQSLRENYSHQKEVEAQKAAVAASTSRERFLEIVSHDIKTPLTSIQLITESLKRDPSFRPETHAQLEKILKNLSRIERIVSDVLNQAKLDSGTLQANVRALDLAPFLQGLVEEFEEVAKTKGIRMEVRCDADLNVEADSTLLFQAIGNLLGNAIKFSPQGGRIILSAHSNSENVIIRVADEGPGIARENLPFIFEKFYKASQPSQSGFGLGLFICREIVNAHSGKITVQSDVGAGTIFSVEFPRGQRKQMLTTHARDEGSSTCNVTTILLVEDDVDLNEVLCEIFERRGYAVVACSSVAEARAAIAKRSPALALVVTDFRLGDGNANEVLASLDQAAGGSSVRRILLSADWSIQDMNHIPRVDKILKKPINTDDLLREVERLAGPGKNPTDSH